MNMKNNFNFNACAPMIQKEYETKQNIMLVQDILDIACHKYDDYVSYERAKQGIIRDADLDADTLDSFTITVRPIIVDEDMFNYASYIGSKIKKELENKEK